MRIIIRKQLPSKDKAMREIGANAFMTVETAMLMPVIFLTVFLAVYLSAHVHGRTFLYERAAEQAVSGKEQAEVSLFALTSPEKAVSETEKKRTVRYTASSAYFENTSYLSISEEVTYRIDEPVKKLRKARAARKTLSDMVQ